MKFTEIAAISSNEVRDNVRRQTMTVDQYLSEVMKNPGVCRLASERLYDMILSHGKKTIDYHGRRLTRWEFFHQEGAKGNRLFGMEQSLHNFMILLTAAAAGGNTSKRIILLHGPVGAAKSTIATLIKRGLEEYSKTEQGAMYTFRWVANGLSAADTKAIFARDMANGLRAPMCHDPIYLLPDAARTQFIRAVNEKNKGGYQIKDNNILDPLSTDLLRRLLAHYENDWAAVVTNHVVVERMVLSESERVGIATYQPRDEKSQDSTELTGDINYRILMHVGDEADPRASAYRGEFHIANRGIIEFVEMLKLGKSLLYDLLTASQERAIKPRNGASCRLDTMIIAHTNEPELRKLHNDETMEALSSRISAVDVPYLLNYLDEKQVYDRDHNSALCHVDPHTHEAIAYACVASRIDAPLGNVTRPQKLSAYAGRTGSGVTQEHVLEMLRQGSREGLDTGFSPRHGQSVLEHVKVAEGPIHKCINGFQALRELKLRIDSLPTSVGDKVNLRHAVELATEHYQQAINTDVRNAIANDSDGAEKVWEKYIAHLTAYVNSARIRDEFTQELVPPDEEFLDAIEEGLESPTPDKRERRTQLMNTIAMATMRKGSKPAWDADPKMSKAIQTYLFKLQRGSLNLRALSTGSATQETKERVKQIIGVMVDKYNYCPVCARKAILFVSSSFRK